MRVPTEYSLIHFKKNYGAYVDATTLTLEYEKILGEKRIMQLGEGLINA